MTEKPLPKLGDHIPAKLFFISKFNIRESEPFGEDEQDRMLSLHLTVEGIKQPFVARPEGEGYGVIMGRRRFLAKWLKGVKEFVIGEDCIIKVMSDYEALNSSILENLDFFKKDLNLIQRAESIKKLMKAKNIGLTELSRQWNTPKSTLSVWLKILELNPAMQRVIGKGLLGHTDALNLTYMKLDDTTQNRLAEILETEDYEDFQREVRQLKTETEKRGSPKGKYDVFRVTFDKSTTEDVSLLDKWNKLAEVLKKNPVEMTKEAMRFYMDKND